MTKLTKLHHLSQIEWDLFGAFRPPDLKSILYHFDEESASFRATSVKTNIMSGHNIAKGKKNKKSDDTWHRNNIFFLSLVRN